MYKQYLEIKNTNTGKGVFAMVQLPANLPILEFGGDFFTKNTLKHGPELFLQVGPDLYLGPSGQVDDYVNHSCEPNCSLIIVGNRAILYSLYVIPEGREITFDYSTSSTDKLSDWAMPCKCGKVNCRKVISGYQYLDNNIKKMYFDKDMLPLFIREKIFR